MSRSSVGHEQALAGTQQVHVAFDERSRIGPQQGRENLVQRGTLVVRVRAAQALCNGTQGVAPPHDDGIGNFAAGQRNGADGVVQRTGQQHHHATLVLPGRILQLQPQIDHRPLHRNTRGYDGNMVFSVAVRLHLYLYGYIGTRAQGCVGGFGRLDAHDRWRTVNELYLGQRHFNAQGLPHTRHHARSSDLSGISAAAGKENCNEGCA